MPYLLLVSVAVSLGVYLWTRKKRSIHKRDRDVSYALEIRALSTSQKGFLLYAITLEAQQVQLYKRFARKARKAGKDHLAVGFERAMEVEATHLMKLRQEARKRKIKNTVWSRIGNSLGRATGQILSAFGPRLPLESVVTIENQAAKHYSEARKGLQDQTLLDLYLVNQVDEEYHASWAKAMLDHPDKLRI
ncbi:MAG: demethoxyubiquinone hydroxylase family protein [Bacillota bacterium]